MMKVMGALLLFLGCSSAGIMKAQKLKNDFTLTEDFLQALSYAQREITQTQRSLPEIFYTLQEKQYTTVGNYFKKLYESLDESTSFREKWDESIHYQKELPEPLLETIRPLGGILGQYDSEKQGESISHILTQLERLKETQEEEISRLSKVYTVSGMTLGLFLVIIMF